MIEESIKKFFENNCPLLAGKKLKVDCLGEKVTSCCIEASPTGRIVRKYPDGGSLRQFVFVFATREYFDSDAREQLKTAAFYEKFYDWIEECDENRTFPTLEDGLEPVGWEVLSSGYQFKSDLKTARYQIQLRLLYERE